MEEDPQFIAKENLMTKIAKTNARHDLTELGHQFEDFIIYCTFRGINCAYVNFFKIVIFNMPLRCRRMNYRKKYFNFYLNVITLKFVHVKTRQLTEFLSNVFSHKRS